MRGSIMNFKVRHRADRVFLGAGSRHVGLALASSSVFSFATRGVSLAETEFSAKKTFHSFSAEDEQQLLTSLISHPRRILRKVRLNVQTSAQRLMTFRNLLTQIMIVLQNRLRALAKLSSEETNPRAEAEYAHISRLLEMMLEECREFRCVDLAHLIFRAWIRFHGKYGLTITSEAVLVLLDIAKRNILMLEKEEQSKIKATRAFLDTIAGEMEKIPTTLQLALIPRCYLGDDEKVKALKGRIIAQYGCLTPTSYVHLAEGYGNMNRPDELFALLKQCLHAEKLCDEGVGAGKANLKRLKALTVTHMIEASILTLSRTSLGLDAKAGDRLPSDPKSPLHVIHQLASFHRAHGYGCLSKDAIASIAGVYLFRRNAKNSISLTSIKFCRNVDLAAVEGLLTAYCSPGKGFPFSKSKDSVEKPSFDFGMLGMKGLCALIAANGFRMKQKTSEVDDIMKAKVDTLLTIIMQRMKGTDIDLQRTNDMIEGQHIVVCIRGLVSFNENERILELFRVLQSTCYRKNPSNDTLISDEFSSHSNLLNYDIYREFISAFGRLGNIRDVLYIKSQLEKDPVYGWEHAHRSYSFKNGKEHSSSCEALVSLYGTLLRIFRASYPHHFRSIENELRDRKLNLNAICYSALLEFYVVDRSEDATAVHLSNPDGGRGVSKRFLELTDEIDKRAAHGSPVWSPYLLKVLIRAHTFTPLEPENHQSNEEISFKATKSYSYIILAKRLGYTREAFVQKVIVRFFLVHGCKEELRKFLLDVGTPSREIDQICEESARPEKDTKVLTQKIWDLPNIDICNSLIEYHGSDTFHKGALQSLLLQMETKGVALNENTFVLLIEIYGRWGEEEKLEGLLTRLNETTSQKVSLEMAELPVKQSLSLDLEIKATEDANEKKIPPFILANEFVLTANFFSTLAMAYNTLGKPDHEIENIWENLLSTTLPVTSMAYNIFLDIFVNRMNFALVEKVLAVMMDKVPPNVLTLTTVIDLLGRMGQIEEMEKVFEEMMKSKKPTEFDCTQPLSVDQSAISCFPTTVTFHHIMSAYAKRGDVFKMLNILEKMKENDIPLTAVTYNILVAGYCRARQFNKVTELIEERKKVVGSDIDIITSLVWIKSLGLCQLEDEVKVVEAQVMEKQWLDDKRVKLAFKFKLLHTLALAFRNCRNDDRAVHYAQILLSDTYASKVTFFYISSVLRIYCTLQQDSLIEKFIEKYITFEQRPAPLETNAETGHWETSFFESPKGTSSRLSISQYQVSSLANIVLRHYCKVKQMNKVEDLLKKLAQLGIKFNKGKESIEISSYVLELKAHKQKEAGESAMYDVSSEIDALFSKPGDGAFSESQKTHE